MTVPGGGLRNDSASPWAHTQQGENVAFKDGEPVNKAVPVRRPPLPKAQLLQRWETLPPVDAKQFREDVDATLD